MLQNVYQRDDVRNARGGEGCILCRHAARGKREEMASRARIKQDAQEQLAQAWCLEVMDRDNRLPAFQWQTHKFFHALFVDCQ